jgi:hypothetical protein
MHREYLERAAECRRKAEAAITSTARNNYLEAETRWLAVAATYAEADQPAADDPIEMGEIGKLLLVAVEQALQREN